MDASIGKINHLLYGPDGSRRFAAKQGIPFAEAYDRTARKLVEFIEWCFGEHPIDEVSLAIILGYNLGRDNQHITPLLRATVDGVEYLIESEIVGELDLQIKVVGDLHELLQKDDASIARLDGYLGKVRNHQGKKVNILAPYDGNKELEIAWRLCIKDGVEPTLENLALRCSIPPITHAIRTGQPNGVSRLSTYFPGIEQARLLSTPTYPQDLTRHEFNAMISTFLNLKDSYDRL